MEALTWNIGSIKITSIVEIVAGKIIQDSVPEATQENIMKMPWLIPDFADKEGNLKAVVQSFVIDDGERTVIVDTCNGNEKMRTDLPEWGMLQTDFLTKLESAGYPKETIDYVLCTHLHFDHVGWNTERIDGELIPTFPNARYLFAKKEYNYWKKPLQKEMNDDKQGIVDSVRPIIEAGLADLVSTDHQISEEISLIPTPGHTAGHVSVLVESEGKKAIITGDAFHHPCHITHPEWETVADTYPDRAIESRMRLIEDSVDDTLILGSHFAPPTSGFIVKEGDTYIFKHEN